MEAAAQAADLLAAGASRVTMVADREADLYEMFACLPEGVEVLVRARHDRCLMDGGRLYETREGQPELGRETIELPSIPGRPARRATFTLYARRVSIKRPKRNRAEWPAELPESVSLALVEAREIDPPPGVVADAHGMNYRPYIWTSTLNPPSSPRADFVTYR